MKKNNKTITIFEVNPIITMILFIVLAIIFIACIIGLSKDNEEFIKQCTSKGYSEQHCERVAYE